MNTYNGLYSLYFEKVHIACAAAAPEDVRSLVPGLFSYSPSLLPVSHGLYVKKGNPRNIHDFPDLTRADIIFANREKGSSRRVLLDRTLKSSGISPNPYPVTVMSLFPTIPQLPRLPVGRQMLHLEKVML